MLKRFLYAVLVAVVILAITWGVATVIAALPIPFNEVLVTLVWIVGGVSALWVLGRVLIDLVPSGAP